ncbi:protein kinase domain-containing protein [Rubritalea profundi]|uniref:non-specific serine/threonine protein kinase n=1 Tax=Rubritalea profundi TaxID=1658618 RepID=A0A2S7U3I5_9BACT|nr:protein kinase [Rubritalea profundi]PQJ29578.1 hypothetical protein BSZ32_14485 [Rubritalea profundi]
MKTGQRYRLKSTLGTGGFGSVYKAYDSKLNRDVALKRLNKGASQESVRAKLMDEARVLATLQHPNIVAIYDVSSHKEFDEIVMELIVGVTLRTFVKRHLLQPNDFKHIAAQILHGLAASHKAGVLHCDIKPENVMLCLSPEDQYDLKIFDFGISESMDNADPSDNLTLVGSVNVMAPELFDRKKPTEQSDIYALGCLFYYLLTGAYPFVGAGSLQVMAAHLKGKFRPISEIRADLDIEFCDWIESFLKVDPAQRVDSCTAALEQLLKFEFSEKLGVFTLPTDLEFESVNSRVVRTLTRRSLALESESDSQRGSRFLTNTITNSLGISKSAKQVLEESGEDLEDPFSPRAKLLPEKAEWYFTKGDAAKGPVSLDQLYRLVEDDKIEAGSMVWHPHYGEWVHAFSVAELKPFFPENAGDEASTEDEGILPSAPEAWFGLDLVIALIGAIAVGAWIYFSPSMIMEALAVYGIILFLTGLVYARVHQFKASIGWFVLCLVLPFIGDIIYAFKKKSHRVTICVSMLLIGAVTSSVIGAIDFFGEGSQFSLARFGLDKQ